MCACLWMYVSALHSSTILFNYLMKMTHRSVPFDLLQKWGSEEVMIVSFSKRCSIITSHRLISIFSIDIYRLNTIEYYSNQSKAEKKMPYCGTIGNIRLVLTLNLELISLKYRINTIILYHNLLFLLFLLCTITYH